MVGSLLSSSIVSSAAAVMAAWLARTMEWRADLSALSEKRRDIESSCKRRTATVLLQAVQL